MFYRRWCYVYQPVSCILLRQRKCTYEVLSESVAWCAWCAWCAVGLEPSSAQQEAAAAAGEQSSAPAPTADQQELLQQLHEQLQHLIDERQDDLRAAFKELGLPEPELRLDSDGDDESSSSSSSRPRQLTGR